MIYFILGVFTTLALVALTFVAVYVFVDKCKSCGSRRVGYTYKNASSRLYRVCHRCGWEES
jgi:hypothetical protein